MTKKIELLDESRGYDGFFKIDNLSFRHSLFQGGWTPIISRELFGRGQAVVVLLYDLKAQKVILVEQCRAGALKHAQKNHEKAWLVEPVAGMIDEGEKPIDACCRETLEEAGTVVAPQHFEYICQFYPSPGGSSEILHLYATEVNANNLPEYAGLENEQEDIHLLHLDFAEAKKTLLNGQFNVASTIIALQWLFFQKLSKET